MTEEVTGIDVLRDALRARHMNTAALARDLQIPAEALHQWAVGAGHLSPDMLQKLTTYLFGGHVQYDAAINRLRSTNTAEPRSLGVHPPRVDPTTLPYYAAGAARSGTPQPLVKTKPLPKQHRPGWWHP